MKTSLHYAKDCVEVDAVINIPKVSFVNVKSVMSAENLDINC